MPAVIAPVTSLVCCPALQRLESLQIGGQLIMFPNDTSITSAGAPMVVLHLEHLMCTIGTSLVERCASMVKMGLEHNPYVAVPWR